MNTNAGNRGTILIVDDDPAVLVLIQNLLSSADYRVLLAAERADAMRIAAQKHVHIDVLLLDVRIPGVVGSELADAIVSMRPDIRVLWMSGFVDEEFIRVKLLDGHASFLSKPLHRPDLLMAIQQAVEAGPSAGDTPAKTLTAGAVS